MSETRETIRIRAQRILGTAINLTINDAIRTYHRTLQRRHSYRFMDAVATIPVSAGDTTFALPDDFKEPIHPEMSDADRTGFRRMRRVIKNGIDARSTDDEGRPLLYRIFDGVGHLYARAGADFTFRLEYTRYFPYLDSDTAPAGKAGLFLDDVWEALFYFAVAEGKRRFNQIDVGDYWENRAEKKRLELQISDVNFDLAGADLQMEMEG